MRRSTGRKRLAQSLPRGEPGAPGGGRGSPADPAASRRSPVTAARRWGRLVAGAVVGIAVAVMTAWAAGAIYYSDIPGARLRGLIAATFVLATAIAFIVLPRRRRTLAGFVVV